jgi:hypothetical protein
MRVTLINPLGASLDHYAAALARLLEDAEVSVRVESISEPSSAPYGRLRWLAMYTGLLTSRRRSAQPDETVVVTWPVLGYWDFALIRMVAGRASPYLILHDPRPLARAVGYGNVSRWVAGRKTIRAKAIVHSEEATRAVARAASGVPATRLPLPMVAPRLASARNGDGVVVRVLGRYKPVRDLVALEQIAASCDPAWRYEIVGRGWPPVKGWTVTNAFVTESEFARLIATSSAVLIPYRRFFQSDVALRCLEMGTPVVGPHDSSLAELLGSDSRCLARDGRWGPAIDAAVRSNPTETLDTAQRLYDDTSRRWRSWLAEIELDRAAARSGAAMPYARKLLRRSGGA